MKEKIAAYVRVSTEKESQELSYQGQQQFFLREYGNEYEVLIYADEGISGTKLQKRPEFERMLYDAGLDKLHKLAVTEFEPSKKRKPLFHRILVRNTSRFARNILSVAILRALKNVGVYVRFLDKDIDTKDENWEVFYNIFMTFDQQESTDKSKKIRDGLKESARRGQIYTNDKIYGYKYYAKKYYGKEENRLEIVEEEAQVIRELFDLYTSGEGIRRILNIFKVKGYKTRKGKDFSKSTILRMLNNEKYCGILIRNKYDTGIIFHKHSTYKIRPESEWVTHENVIPAIISKEQFEQAQSMKDKKKHSKLQKGIYKGRSAFAGKIKCQTCGANYIRNRDRGRAFFNCSTKKTQGLQACSSPNVSELHLLNVVEKTLPEVVGMIESNKNWSINILESVKVDLLNNINKDSSEEVKELKNQLGVLNNKKTKLLDLYLEDNYDKDTLIIKTEEIEKQVLELELKTKELSKTNDDILLEVTKIDKHISEIKNFKVVDYDKQELQDLLRFKVCKKNDNAGEYYLFVSVTQSEEIQFNKTILSQYSPYFVAMDRLEYGLIQGIR